MNLITIFLTGLLTGGLTCLAVQGGLLASILAQEEEENLQSKKIPKNNILPIILFVLAKLVAYTIFGLLLGLFGSFFQLSLSLKVLMQFLVGIFMLGTAFNLLNLHPIFRYFIIQPPKFLYRLARKQTKNDHVFAPILTGAFTVFIPCGATQGMMALAIASGNPLNGAIIMFTFILGTTPLFFTLGYFTSKLGEIFKDKFLKIAAVGIIILAFLSINSAFALTGTNLIPQQTSSGDLSQAATEATINILANRYEPNIITVKAGAEITLNVTNTGGYGCIQAFTIPQLGIQKIVAPGNTQIIKFKAPENPTNISFMCSMGMYRGIIKVIK